MKKILLSFLVFVISLAGPSVFSQTDEETAPALGLPGDNLDLYAVLDLFQKSKTIEDFEKSLNQKETGINNLDLDLDKKVDFIKVVTKKKDDSFTFILQVAVTKSETQDVAVILVDKAKDGKVSLQIVGDEDLYGKDYVIEPKTGTPSVTANPAYTGSNPVTVNTQATVVVVEQAPIVQYVYSPYYAPYYPPYYYGYYPPYFAAFTVMAVGIYRHNNWYHHGGYHGGHYGGHNTVIINNRNNYNNYNNNKMRSSTVERNNSNGQYGNRESNRATAGTSDRASAGGSNRASAGTSDRAGASNRAANKPSAGTSDRAGSSNRAANKASTGASDRAGSSNRAANNRTSTGASDRAGTSNRGANNSNRASSGASNRASSGASNRASNSSSVNRPSSGNYNRSSSPSPSYNSGGGGGRTRSGGGGGFSGGGGRGGGGRRG